MDKKILVDVGIKEKRIAIVSGKTLDDFYVEREGEERIVGNIYKGRVKSIVRGIQAAFIDIGEKRNGFLYLSDILKPTSNFEEILGEEVSYGVKEEVKESKIGDFLKEEQDILVQVVKGPLGRKGPRLATHISLPGRYLVLMPTDGQIAVSRKIEDEKERLRLRELLKEIKLRAGAGLGIIARTRAAGQNKSYLQKDLKFLLKLWQRIKAVARRHKSPCLVHQEYDLTQRIIRDFFTDDFERLIVDTKAEYRKVAHFIRSFLPHLKTKIEFYKEPIPLFERFNLEGEIKGIYQRKVSLPSGGSIIIEETEAVIVIDVNTGSFKGRKDLEDTVFITNLEAAKEIARQLRLRDLGGIIVIDFIDMKKASHRRKVSEVLADSVRHDKARTKISNLSEMGLLEMTRQRTGRSIESAAYDKCLYCEGKGMVKSKVTMSVLAFKEIEEFLRRSRSRKVTLYAHPQVASYIRDENKDLLSRLQSKFRARIAIESDSELHIEDIRI